MTTVNVPQRFTEKQCFSAAYDLIQTVIDIKDRHPEGKGYPGLINDPHVKVLLIRLEAWTDMLVAKEGGL